MFVCAWCQAVSSKSKCSWWRHQMETFSALLAFCAGNSPVLGEFPKQRPVTRSFDVFFDLRLNKRLSKQSWGWWFDTPSRSLLRHCNVNTSIFIVFSRYFIFYFMQAVYESVTRKNRVPYIVNTTVENWKNHIEYICKKLSKCIGILSKARRKLQNSS